MTKDEARRLTLDEWDRWAPEWLSPGRLPAGTDGLVFFGYLERQRSHLLEFEASEDRWKVIHGWLLRAHKVND